MPSKLWLLLDEEHLLQRRMTLMNGALADNCQQARRADSSGERWAHRGIASAGGGPLVDDGAAYCDVGGAKAEAYDIVDGCGG